MTIKIIAEAGVNHNGDKALAFKLVKAASDAGADIVKFQTFKAESLVTKSANQADYQMINTGSSESQYEMLKRLELDYETHIQLKSYCEELGIEFLSTAFDSDSLRFLVEDLGLKTLKIPSGELTNAPLMLEHAQTGCDLIVSTGMASLAEIERALSVIAFGLVSDPQSVPSDEKFNQAYSSDEGQLALVEKVTLLHCTTEYPAPMADINLKAMDTLRSAFNLSVGYSDHSEGVAVSIAAAAREASLLEKHFTLDKSLPGPDHKASLSPEELQLMVSSIRSVQIALGNGRKVPKPSEVKNKTVARKSLVASTSIRVGEKFSKNNISIKRPGNGISPYLYWSVLGKTASHSYCPGDLIVE